MLYDALGEEEAKLTAAAKLGQTDRTIYFSGWIPERRAEKTKKKLLETADAAVSLRDPLEGEEFPILLVNNKFNQAFEVILTPVSYTHLDVYKRQRLCSGSLRRASRISASVSNSRMKLSSGSLTKVTHRSTGPDRCAA